MSGKCWFFFWEIVRYGYVDTGFSSWRGLHIPAVPVALRPLPVEAGAPGGGRTARRGEGTVPRADLLTGTGTKWAPSDGPPRPPGYTGTLCTVTLLAGRARGLVALDSLSGCQTTFTFTALEHSAGPCC